MRIIEGFAAFSRFGYAMTNLGDISGDGYDGESSLCFNKIYDDPFIC